MLNIKDRDTYALAKEVAKVTNESMTQAVKVALQERLERLRRKADGRATAEKLLEIGRSYSKLAGETHPPSERAADFLYDDRGLPK